MGKFLRDRLDSFAPAFQGWRHVIRTQPNAWIHAAISLFVFLMGFWLQLPLGDWALIVLAMAMVWITEFINTAIEAAVDLLSPEHHQLAKVAKDVSSGAVVIAAVAAVIIGLLALGPPLWNKLGIAN